MPRPAVLGHVRREIADPPHYLLEIKIVEEPVVLACKKAHDELARRNVHKLDSRRNFGA